jgi:transcriptional regulator with XRE-family HTH domain
LRLITALGLDQNCDHGNLTQNITFVIRIITNVIELNHSITIVNNFAERLRYIRQLRKLTQAALAKASGLSQGAVANYEGGTRHSPREIFELAGALHVNALWLSHGRGPMEPGESLPTPSRYHVADRLPAQQASGWPFPTVPPAAYWALSKNDRALVENMAATLAAAHRRKRSDP